MKKETTDTISKIDPKAEYSLSEIAREGLLGADKSYFVCRNIVNEDRWEKESKRILNAEKKGNGVGTTYYVKGKNLIKYLKANG